MRLSVAWLGRPSTILRTTSRQAVIINRSPYGRSAYVAEYSSSKSLSSHKDGRENDETLDRDEVEPLKKRRGRPKKTDVKIEQPPALAASSNHKDLHSFIDYAARIGLDKSSTTFNGTLYEYTVLESLKRFKFDLTRTGGRSDRGIDLLGTWNLPTAPVPLRALIQCKFQSGASTIQPSYIRELEGAFLGAPSGWRGEGVMALLVTTREATKGVREAMARSNWPMGFLTIDIDGSIRQFLWNHGATRRGLEGIGVTLRHSPRAKTVSQEIALTLNSRPWP